MGPHLLIIRGWPGSGKSTLAKTYVTAAAYNHFEADNWHFDRTGKYVFEKCNTEKSHNWCILNTENSIRRGNDTVVSNVFIKNYHIVPYYHIAKLYNCTFEVITLKNNFGNVHNVPDNVLNGMTLAFEEYNLEMIKDLASYDEESYSYKNNDLCEG